MLGVSGVVMIASNAEDRGDDKQKNNELIHPVLPQKQRPWCERMHFVASFLTLIVLTLPVMRRVWTAKLVVILVRHKNITMHKGHSYFSNLFLKKRSYFVRRVLLAVQLTVWVVKGRKPSL